MAVKMPVLGQSARRKSSGLGWVLFLGLAVAAGGYLWHRRHRPAPRRWPRSRWSRPSPVISAPGSTAVPGLAQAPVAASGADRPAVPLGAHRRSARGGAGGGAGNETGPALTQVVKRVLVWWITVPARPPQGRPAGGGVRAAAGAGAAGQRGAAAEREGGPHLRGVPVQAGGRAVRAVLRRRTGTTSSCGSTPRRSTAGSRSPRCSRTAGSTRAWTSRRRWARR